MKRALVWIGLLVVAASVVGSTSARSAPVAIQGSPTASINDVTVTEGDAGTVTATFTISLSRVIDFPVTISYATADESATVAGNDYVAASGSVSFGIEQPIFRTISVQVVGDTTVESDEAFHVNLTTNSDILLFDPLGVGTIVDDDGGVECTYAISPTSAAFSAAGGTGTVMVTAPAGCVWTATSNDTFLTIQPDSGGNGSGTVGYTVAPNGSPSAREGTLTIAGLTFAVTQGGTGTPPFLTVSEISVTEGDAGTVDAIFTISLSQPIDFALDVTYETLDSSADADEGDYVHAEGVVTFGPEQPLTRSVTVLVNGDTENEINEQFDLLIANDGDVSMFPNFGRCTIVNDDVTGCSYTVEPPSKLFTPEGGESFFHLSTASDCQWTARSNDEFITVPSEGLNFRGSGDLRYSVAPNPGEQPRTGSITAGNAVFVVFQAGGSLPTVSIDNTGLMEGDVSAILSGAVEAPFMVRLSEAVPYPVTVRYATANGTAPGEATGGGVDFVDAAGFVFFDPGETELPLPRPVTINGDLVEEDVETIRVVLSEPSNARLGIRGGLCRVYDDDTVLRACAPGPTPIVPGDATGPRSSVSRLTLPDGIFAATVTVRRHVTIDDLNNRNDEILEGPHGTVSNSTHINTRGTTCSPVPDFATDEDPGGPPGGAWSLRIVSYGDAGAIECFCVEAKGGPTGILLTPTRTAGPVFQRQGFTAKVFSQGEPLRGATLYFYATRHDRPDLDLVETRVSDDNGEALFTYTRDIPGTDTVTVEVGNRPDVGISAEAEVRWGESAVCPMEKVSDGATVADSRKLRDSVLAGSEHGRRYTDLYYRFAGEVVRIMMLNPMLMLRSREIVERYRPVIAAMAAGETVTLTSGDLDEIESLLGGFAERGTPELRDAIEGACRDLRDPRIQTDLHLRVEQGPKRQLPRERSALGPLGPVDTPIWPALFGLLGVARRRRRQSSLRPRACALVSLALVSLALLPRPALAGAPPSFSTYLGGSGDDEANAIAVDSAGNTYLAGFTDSADFPTTNALQAAFGGGSQDAFVTKLDPSGAVVYSTYLGGSGQDNAGGIAVDAAGNAYVAGFTGSTDFPTRNARQSANAGRFNAFVAQLDPSGRLVFSTYLGGSAGDYASAVAVAASGEIYVAGVATSPDFPTANAVQSTHRGAADAFVARLDSSATQIEFSTFVGGAGDDGATGLAIDGSGDVYVTGVTSSRDFPTVRPFQASFGGGLFDGFVARLDASGARLGYASYVGGSGDDRAFRVAVDPSGDAFVAGDTDSPDLATVRAPQPAKAGGVDAFVLEVDSSGALVVSTYLGGSGVDGATAIGVDGEGGAYVVGYTSSIRLPSSSASQDTFGGGAFDAFAAKLAPNGMSIRYATHLGGSGIDAGFGVAVGAGGVCVMGQTTSTDLPTSNAAQPAFGGGASDVFVATLAEPPAAGPTVVGAGLRNGKLVVTGEGFAPGATILVDGRALSTKNARRDPSTGLVGRRPRIARGQTVTLVVENPDGTASPEFRFTR